MNPSLTRRQALAGLSLPFVVPSVLSHDGTDSSIKTAFIHGLASGDPRADSIVLWTRVSGFTSAITVRWQLALEAGFVDVVRTGELVTGPQRDYTVKVVPDGLEAGQVYFYRFQIADDISDVGRTRTLPAGATESLGLAVVSCSNYPFGYFNCYEAIALDSAIQFVVHLGDYIYEYGPEGFGGVAGKELAREHRPAYETVSLSDYRVRHAQYKSDPQSRMMHQAHPVIVVWDDHESTNNPWAGGAENHQPEREGDWLDRREASIRAYFEWMPIREPGMGERRIDYWRNYQFGDLANLVTLETRHSARSQQFRYSDYETLLSDTSGDGAATLMKDMVGDPSRRMLSTSMENFLETSLLESVKEEHVWHLIGNPIPMARTHAPPLSPDFLQRLRSELQPSHYARAVELAKLGKQNLPLYLDPWDGYPVAREAFYALCRKAGVTDLLVLTGDSHSFWQNALFDDSGRSMGVELGTSGVTSPGDFLAFGNQGALEMDRLLASANEEVVWTDGRHNGYIRLQLSHSGGVADYIAVSAVRSREYRVELVRTVPLKTSSS